MDMSELCILASSRQSFCEFWLWKLKMTGLSSLFDVDRSTTIVFGLLCFELLPPTAPELFLSLEALMSSF